MIKLDLHGKTRTEAKDYVENTLMKLGKKGSFQAEIITGNSAPMRDLIVEDVLEYHKFQYAIPSNNQGVIIVTYADGF